MVFDTATSFLRNTIPICRRTNTDHNAYLLSELCNSTVMVGKRDFQHGGAAAAGWPTQNFGWVGHNAFVPTNNWPVFSLFL